MISLPQRNEFMMFTEFVSMDLVRFENVKNKYYINEDITLEYVLNSQIRPSSHNWVGLFPRGFSNLQQYAAFEWTIYCPRDELSSRHKTIFHSKYHVKKVCLNEDYQFLYINKQMKVLGATLYFRFLPAEKASDETNRESLSLSDDLCSSSHDLRPPPHFNPLGSFFTSPRPCGPVVTSPVHHRQLWHQHHQTSSPIAASKSLSRGYASEITLTSPDLPPFTNINGSNGIVTCAHCKRPTDFVRVQQVLTSKIKAVAEQNRALESRVRELERDLEMSQVGQKKMRLAVQHSKHEKLAYQKFVNEMLVALSQKGVVRVIDGQGTEMILKRMLNVKSVVDEHGQGITKTSHRERLLKAVIGSQEQTIRDLLERLEESNKGNRTSTPINNLHGDLIDLDSPYDSTMAVTHIKNTLEDLKWCLDSKCSEKSNTSPVVPLLPQTDCDSIDQKREERNENLRRLLDETYSMGEGRGQALLAEMVVEAVVHAPTLDETFDVRMEESCVKETTEQLQVENQSKAESKEQTELMEKDMEAVQDVFSINKTFDVPTENSTETLQRQQVMQELMEVISKRHQESTQEHESESEGDGGEPVEQLEKIPDTSEYTNNAEKGTALVIKGDHLQLSMIR